jgi:glycosyltransferase involved in cell wall biosynthesis
MPRIAVVTPYYKESLEWLRQCHESVLAQGVPAADHYMVADGFPRRELAEWNVRHVVLPDAHADGGAMGRGIGSILAGAAGYDFVAYLDADNWFLPGHIESLLELHRTTGAPVCTSFRSFYDLDDGRLDVTEEAEDLLQHVDTNCFFVHRSAFKLFPVWTHVPKQLGPLCDRVFLAALRNERFMVLSTKRRTLAYRITYELHYRGAGREPPPGYKPMRVLEPAVQWLQTKEGVEESIRRLGFWPLSFM